MYWSNSSASEIGSSVHRVTGSSEEPPPANSYTAEVSSPEGATPLRRYVQTSTKFCRSSGCDAQFVKNTLHTRAQGLVMPVNGSGIVRSVAEVGWLRRRQQRLQNLVA